MGRYFINHLISWMKERDLCIKRSLLNYNLLIYSLLLDNIFIYNQYEDEPGNRYYVTVNSG